MLEKFDHKRATYFAYCCGAATHFNPKMPYRPMNAGILFAMEEIKPFDPENEETFAVQTSAGLLHFCGVTNKMVKSNPAFNNNNTTFSGDYMGSGKTDMDNKGEGVFPPDTIKHGQFKGMVTNKTYQQFLDHKGVCLWVDVVPPENKTHFARNTECGTFYDLLKKNPEFKEIFDASVIYRSDKYCNMREPGDRILQLIVTDRGAS